jgi:hypothetical protein
MFSNKTQITRSIVVALLSLFLTGSAFAGAAAPPVAALGSEPALQAGTSPAPSRVTPATKTTGPGETQRYASREASAKSLAAFRGGDGGIYIGGGALVTALLIVLLIVLI